MEENVSGTFVANNKSKPQGRNNYEKRSLLVGRKALEKKEDKNKKRRLEREVSTLLSL